jgi:hypothetical protein
VTGQTNRPLPGTFLFKWIFLIKNSFSCHIRSYFY